jgi:hypothetical protein
MNLRKLAFAGIFSRGIATGIFLAHRIFILSGAQAKEPGGAEPLISPTEALERDFYAPNSETLAPEEMRVIACGTGMPFTRMAQAVACFLVELGNGDKFIFDIGSGSAERLSALQIPYDCPRQGLHRAPPWRSCGRYCRSVGRWIAGWLLHANACLWALWVDT